MKTGIRPIRKLLVANRGEIAVRVILACRELGIRTVAVHSDIDRSALFVSMADEAVCIGSAAPKESYLRIDRILEAAKSTGADAVHPGYGFLSENEDFASAVEQAGLVFVGPRPETIVKMGSKTAARKTMASANVPTIPGYQGEDRRPETLREHARTLGYPVLVKADMGGGGKGMRIVHDDADMVAAVAAASREAEKAFGDGSVYLEKYIEKPRHIEVQVLGDTHGGCVHVYERECSLQRRHQKVIEESPSPSLSAELRQRICLAGVQAARAVNYHGAGTVEFIVGPDGEFYFLEMNTRLQVEHPITELVCGVDLVVAQIKIAQGERLPWSQEQIGQRGHAIECRIYAEDPENGFLPSIGALLRYDVPFGPGVRHDGGFRQGDEVSVDYDPMLGKLIVLGETRDAAIGKMIAALDRMVVHGVRTNIAFLRHLLTLEAFRNGDFHTRWLDESFDGWSATEKLPDFVLAAVLLDEAYHHRDAATNAGRIRNAAKVWQGPWVTLGDWRAAGEGGE